MANTCLSKPRQKLVGCMVINLQRNAGNRFLGTPFKISVEMTVNRLELCWTKLKCLFMLENPKFQGSSSAECSFAFSMLLSTVVSSQMLHRCGTTPLKLYAHYSSSQSYQVEARRFFPSLRFHWVPSQLCDNSQSDVH